MSMILALDLGTNSIGWALLNEVQQTITDCGVRIFPEGVNRDTRGKEVSRNEQRRTARQIRRQIQRRKYKKMLLARYLMKHGMFPHVPDLQRSLARKTMPAELKAFFALNPYELRSRGLTEKLSLEAIGRVLYHFAQRRGYRESIKEENEETGVLYEGSVKDGKAGINETQVLIDEHSTLGNALFNTNPHHNRWRNRYTTRKMYTAEFNALWEKQARFHPATLTEELAKKIGDATTGLLFFQHPLKPQSVFAGECIFEKGKKRCSADRVAFELRRMYELINNIRIDGEPLTAHQRHTVRELYFTKEKFNFGDIAKKLKTAVTRLNYEEDHTVAGTRTISTLRKIFTPQVWDLKSLEEQENLLNLKKFAEDRDKTKNYLQSKFGLSEKQADQFIRFRPAKGYSGLSYKATLNILPFLEQGYLYNEAVWLGGIYNALGNTKWTALTEQQREQVAAYAMEIYYNTGVDSVAATRQWLAMEYSLGEKELSRLYHHSVDFEKGDGSFAELPEPENLRNPVVQQALFELRKLVNEIIKVYGKPAQVKVELSRELKSSVAERDKTRLEQYNAQRENDAIKALLNEYGKPHTAHFIQKMKLYREIENRSGNVVCPYSGQSISVTDLFSRKTEIEHIVPYPLSLDDSLANKTLCLVPWNNRKGNRTPYEFFMKELGEQAWEDARKRALSILPYKKYLRFTDTQPKTLSDFETRKLNDTRYISRRAKAWLEHICSDVRVSQGALTAKLRHYWGLDNILNPSLPAKNLEEGKEYFIAVDEQMNILEVAEWEKDKKANDAACAQLAKKGVVLQGNIIKGRFYGYKSRNDHRHHVVDALAIGWTKTSYLQAVSTAKGKGFTAEELEAKITSFPEPWPGYYQQAVQAISGVIVSHKKMRRLITQTSAYITRSNAAANKKIKVRGTAVRGPLHDQTIYGRRKDNYGNTAFHVRKHLSQIKKRVQVDKIADPVVKKLVEAAVINCWQQQYPETWNRYLHDGLIIPSGDGYVISHTSKEKYDVPDGAFFRQEKDETGKQLIAIIPKVYLPVNYAGKTAEEAAELRKNFPNGVPVQKVRLKEQSSGAVALKDDINQWVEPGNNYGIIITRDEQGNLAENIITFWEAVERKKQGLDVFGAGSGTIVATLQIGDIFLLGLPEGEALWPDKKPVAEHLYRVQKLSAGYYVFRKINAATLNFENEQYSIRSFKAWKEANPVKVTITLLGKIQQIK